MKDRIYHLRKEVLHLTMEDFGKRVGLSKAAISQIESGKNNLSDVAIKAICQEYGISETWLRTGEGEMYDPARTFSLDELAKKNGVSDLELIAIKTYFEVFDKDTRKKFMEQLLSNLSGHDDDEDIENGLIADLKEELKAQKGEDISSGSTSA